MKKIFVLAIAIFAFATITPAEAAKKKKNKKQDKVEAVQLANSSDSLSYAAVWRSPTVCCHISSSRSM